MPRFRITFLLVLVAVGLGAMRVASDAVERIVMTLLIFAILLGSTGALVRRTGSWIGFAAFTSSYFLVVLLFLGNHNNFDLITFTVTTVAERLHPTDFEKPARPKVNAGHLDTLADEDASNIRPISHRDVLKMDYDADVPGLTASEQALMKDYQARINTYNERRAEARSRESTAETIGDLFATRILGWIGAIVGRLLKKRRVVAHLAQVGE